MPNKKTIKKSKKPSDNLTNGMKKVAKDIAKIAKNAKKNYDKIDPKTKKQIVAGLAGTAALLIGAAVIKKSKK